MNGFEFLEEYKSIYGPKDNIKIVSTSSSRSTDIIRAQTGGETDLS
jgi:hypothetical protein